MSLKPVFTKEKLPLYGMAIFGFIVFAVGLWVRIRYFNSNPYNDSYRDFLIVYNAVRGDTIPMVGPDNGIFGAFSSPLYFYLLLPLVKIYPTLFWLNLVNFCAQLCAAVCIYLTGNWLFNRVVGLWATCFFWVIPSIAFTATILFQPHVMLPFLYAGLALAAYAYKYKSYWVLVSSGICFALAAVLHNAALPMLVVSAALSLVLLRSAWHQPWSRLCVYVELVFATIVVCYIQPLVFGLREGVLSFNRFGSTVIEMDAFWLNTHRVWNAVSGVFSPDTFSNSSISMWSGGVLGGAYILLTLWFMASSRNSTAFRWQKLRFGYIVALVLSPVLVAVGVQNANWQTRHFVLLVGPLCIASAVILQWLWETKKHLRILTVLLAALTLFVIKGEMGWWVVSAARVHNASHTEYAQAVHGIVEDVIEQQKELGKTDFNFFQLRMYQPYDLGWLDAPYWVGVEQGLERRTGSDIRLTKNDSYHSYTNTEGQSAYGPVGGTGFMYLVCDFYLLQHTVGLPNCLSDYIHHNFHYKLVRQVYTSMRYEIYLLHLQ